jgi:hypothetical protein
VLGASESGGEIYFVSNSVAGDAAAHGASSGDCVEVRAPAGESCNLYMASYDSGARVWDAPVLIATIDGADEK